MSNCSGSSLRTFLFGAVIGAVAGLLYAPEEGEKTRKKLKENLDEGKEKVKEMSEVAKEKAEEVSQEATKEFETLRDKAKEKQSSHTHKESSRPRKFKGV